MGKFFCMSETDLQEWLSFCDSKICSSAVHYDKRRHWAEVREEIRAEQRRRADRIIVKHMAGNAERMGETGMSEEIGTLSALNVQPGDVVEYVSGAAMPYHREAMGVHWTVADEDGQVVARYREEGGGFNYVARCPWIYRIVSRANSGPVRIVTRKEIVAGKYGNVRVYENGDVDLTRTIGGVDELRAAIATLTQIADALAEHDREENGD